MDLADLRRALRRFWLPSLAAFVLTVAAGYLAANRGGSSFESTATIAVAPNPAVDGSADSLEFQIPVIVEKIQSQSFRPRLSARLPEGAMEQVSDLRAARELDTAIVRITAVGRDRDSVAEVANAAALEIIAEYSPSEYLPQATPTTSDSVIIEVIEEAMPEGGSGRDNVVPIMLASVALGVILAIAVAAIAERSSRAFDVATRFRNEVGVPVLAVVPAARELDAADLSTLMTAGPPPLVEAFQGLRARIEVLLQDSRPTLAITSWRRDEGRTTVTAGLALMLSAIGQETVAIDTDLRDPRLHERLGEPFATGLAEFEKLGHANIVTQTRHPNLKLVSAGAAKGHPAHILAVALPATLEEIKVESTDAIVLFDAPPLHPARAGGLWVQFAAETSTVLRAADRVLLVTDGSAAHLPELAVAVERLREDGVTVVGAVLNRRRRRFSWR